MSVDWKKRCAAEKCKARSYERGLRMAFVLASVIVSLIDEMNFGCAKKTAGDLADDIKKQLEDE